MKKVGILVFMICLLMGDAAFAVSREPAELIALADNQKVLFTVPISGISLSDIYDFDFNSNEDFIYIITDSKEETDNEKHEGYQFTFDLEGNLVTSPLYPEFDGFQRMGIEFDGNSAYSLEYYYSEIDGSTSASYVYDAGMIIELGEYDQSDSTDGFAVSGNRIAFHRDREKADVNFDIGTLNPFVSSDGTVAIESAGAGRVAAFDFTPSGSEFIYGAFSCSEDGIGAGFRVKRVSLDTEDLVDEFLLELPGISPDEIEGTDCMYNAIRGLYATDEYIVVMTKVNEKGTGFIQRYTYEGELIEGIEIYDYKLRYIAEGPNDSTLYLYPNVEDNDYLDVMQVKWNVKHESTGRPKAVISERSFGGQTVATFRDNGFGLLRVEDPETGELHYQAPLKSDEPSVKLRVPFFDIDAKIAAGALNLMINYQDQLIQNPMSVFDCADLLAAMLCQDDATIEIQLSADEDGNVTVTIQLYVVEQVNEMTRVVHQKTIQ